MVTLKTVMLFPVVAGQVEETLGELNQRLCAELGREFRRPCLRPARP